MSKAPKREAAESAPAAHTPVSVLKGVGPARERALEAVGVRSVRDLLVTVPRRYEDRRTMTALNEVSSEGIYSLAGRLSRLETVRLYRRRMTMVRATLEQGGATLPVVWFNRPYLESSISADEEYLLHGRVKPWGDGLELVNPSLEPLARAQLGNRIVPVYPALGAVGPSLVRQLIATAIDTGAIEALTDLLPRALLEARELPVLEIALKALHRPPDDADVAGLNASATPAHARLVYEELLRHQAELALARRGIQQLRKRHRYRELAAARREVAAGLSFRLTAAQERVLDEIHADLERRSPMMRLLQGDVGSGKTVVAGVALAGAVRSGLQAALMAPTELLAAQHYRSLRALLGDGYGLRLLTASAGGSVVREELGSGRAGIVVGTHALLQQTVDFHRLGLVIVDEQHRFGVGQRRGLLDKGDRPDLLVMTATPIPRSLALTLYGDLSLSIIDELPPGRRPVSTRVFPRNRRREAYLELKRELEAGNKAFIVLPLIEESDRVEAAAVEGLGRRLVRKLEEYRPEVLHGRMSPEAKAETMTAFAGGDAQVLIATTLVEVGVDVPGATTIVIENAERFGLAQLHQLRGRVGRGDRASRCLAVHGRLTEDARLRLETFESTTDGFELAEADLRIRGHGDLLGTRQAGVPSLRITDLATHREWIERARRDARELVEDSSPEARRFLAQLANGVDRSRQLAGA
ncbi:MAG: ATP-dependent DNA helicase RecG [Thermoanaerobaculia bacterium]